MDSLTRARWMLFLLGITLVLPSTWAAWSIADEKPYIPVGTAKTQKTVVAFPDIRSPTPESSSLKKTITDTVVNDLTFMDSFKFLAPSAFIEKADQAGISLGSFKFPDWASVGAEILIKSEITLGAVGPNQTVVFEAHVYNTALAKEVFTKKYFARPTELKTLAHQFSNDFVFNLTGSPGIFLTKIAASCDRTGKKEIYIMNYDGTEAKQITRHRSISFGPAWSPDGNRIAYSVYTRHANNLKNIDLYEYNFKTGAVRLISARTGPSGGAINGGPAYSPDGKKLAATLSFQGNPEIYLIDPAKTSSLSRITHSMGFDVDPNFSPDGLNIAFVSSRSGQPMVFKMKADGGEVTRLTYAGKYNATPTWSPLNTKIAFAGWLDKRFDIFLMNADGTNIERLSKDQGNNEDPYFSPDGNFLTFSSNRTGKKNIYVMNIDGSFVRRLTYNLGNCVSPKWSNPPGRLPVEEIIVE